MKSLLLYWLLMLSCQLFAGFKSLEQFDKTFYFPQDHGLEDLTFEVHHNKLLENFKNNFSLGNLKELYYKVYWTNSSNVDIEVMGLPEGFQELRDQLKLFIVERLDFVLPNKFQDRYKDFKFVEKDLKGKLVLELNSDEVTAEYSNLILEFGSDGLLNKFTAIDTATRTESKISYKPIGSTQKEFVIDQVETEKLQGIYKTKLSLKLKYDQVSPFTFPVTIEAEGVQSLSKSVKTKDKISPVEEAWVITFKNYKVNTGEASRHFSKKKTK